MADFLLSFRGLQFWRHGSELKEEKSGCISACVSDGNV